MIPEIVKIIINNIMIGVRWGIIFFSFFAALRYLVGALFPNLLKEITE